MTTNFEALSQFRRTDTTTIIKALRVLANEIQSQDGIANAAISEAAERLHEIRNAAVVVVCEHANEIIQRLGPNESTAIETLRKACL